MNYGKSINVMKNVFYYPIVLLLMASCQLAEDRTIAPKDIYGYWQVEGEVNKELPWSKIEVINDSDIWIDPCLDTIYHYRHFAITGDSLILTDHQQKESLYKIDHLKDSVLLISDFKTGVQLRFHKFVDLHDMNNRKPMVLSADDLSPDSLDVNVKSVFVNEYYEYTKKELHILTHDEVVMARNILESYFDKKEYEKELRERRYPYPFNQYIRQYIAIVENGDIIVKVNLITDWQSFDGYTSLKMDVYEVDDGGPSYATAVINLTKGKVVWFMTNGEA
ncbi:hypothetical protein SAMN06298211_102123 [Prevotellaceae bacterium MN60]|nr:hypothetical protein SAMN06298211_102123 [Prevotellaceae bacterium MN60]